jgi:hypothetical protein
LTVYRCLCTNISHLLQETCSRDRQEGFSSDAAAQGAEALLFCSLLPFSLLVLDGHFLGPCTRLSPYHNNPHLPATPASPRNSATPLAIGAVANDWLWRDRSGRLRSPHRFPISDATFFSRTCPRFDWRGSGKSGSDLQILLLGAQCGFLRLEGLTQVPRVSNARMRKVVWKAASFRTTCATSLVCDLSSRTTTSVKKLEIDFRSCRSVVEGLIINQ